MLLLWSSSTVSLFFHTHCQAEEKMHGEVRVSLSLISLHRLRYVHVTVNNDPLSSEIITAEVIHCLVSRDQILWFSATICLCRDVLCVYDRLFLGSWRCAYSNHILIVGVFISWDMFWFYKHKVYSHHVSLFETKQFDRDATFDIVWQKKKTGSD